ncbi:MAG: MATE family efflux transporter [Bacilli bacterium]|nr:MATE family efflux transporter [Bacilli bacterium]MBN2696150.1 MATE family efflux transporter [Bacilli bacterium]
MSHQDRLENMNVKKLLIHLSIPATVGMAVNALYNFVDTLFVAKGVGEIAIGGLALVFPIQMIVMAVGLMIGMGSASVFSRAFGRKDPVMMEKAVNSALRINLIGAILLTIGGFIFLDELLVFFGATASNIGYAKDYMSVILIGLTPLSFSMVLNNLTRAEGRAKIAMISMMIGTGLNIILDPIFIFDFGFGLGVQGAAIATVISQIVAFIYIFSRAFSHKSAMKINLKRFLEPDPKTAVDIMVIGLPSFLRNAIGAFLAIIIYNLINKYSVGDPAIYISVYGVINRVITFVFLPGFGLVQGLAPIVGFNYGARNYRRLKEVIIYATKIITIYFIFGFLFVQLFAEGIFTIFSETGNADFISIGTSAFRVIALGFVLVGFQVVVSTVYQSVGFPVRATIVALSRQVVFFIPLAYILSSVLGLSGIWISFAASDILAGLIGLLLLIFELRSIHRRMEIIESEKLAV